MKDSKVLSVVIGIRDWEPERLELAIRSHLESSIGTQIEVIVSDYGSTDPGPVKNICDKYDCVYQYTEADIWSRSRALNIGLSLSTAEFMVTTDADIIFAPRTLEATVDSLKHNQNSIVLAQCSNLSKDFSLAQAMNLPWDEIYADAVLRPRWGMGGLCAFSQDTLVAVRGFEERMVVWGSEDNDFVKRCRQAGRYVHWISGEDVGIYHVWHPPYLETRPKTDCIYEENKKILTDEFTTARNYLGPTWYTPNRPLVSINIASYNRGDLIGDVIESVLNQSVQDFELLIYDDGSSDNTIDVVNSFSDERIRFFPNTVNAGVATARNKLVQESQGQFICVHDDDDIMLPNRLELQLNAMTTGFVGNYGGWVDYDSATGDLSRQPGKEPFGLPTVAFTGSALAHGTLMVQADVMKRIGYETSFRGGSDYNLAFRMAAAGYKLKHCGDYVILRRVHEASLTGQSSDKQKLSSRITVAPFLNGISNHVENTLRAEAKLVKPVNITPHFNDMELLEYLPDDLFDHLVDIRNIDGEDKNPALSFYASGKNPRHFVLFKGSESGQLIPKGLPKDAYCRILKATVEVEDENTFDTYIESVSTSARNLLCEEITGEIAILQYFDEKREGIRKVLEVHEHLSNSVMLIEHMNKNYIVVDASTYPTAKVIAYSIRAMIGDLSRITSSEIDESHVTTVENASNPELL